MIITEYSHVRDLTCLQHAVGESEVTCSWVAEPPAPFFEIVFSTTEGSGSFKQKVSTNYAEVELNGFIGETIAVTVKNAVTKLKLRGMSMNHLLYEFSFTHLCIRCLG